jgi:hypothetical protein
MQEATEEKKAVVNDKKPDAPKRKNTKRKYLAEAEEKKEVEPIIVEEKVEENEQEAVEQPKVEQKTDTEDQVEEPQAKRVRVTTEEEEEEEPSFFRGGLVKPLLLGLLASGTFFVNNMYKTSVPKNTPPVQPKKKISQQTMPKPKNFMFESKSVRRSIVPGFTQ